MIQEALDFGDILEEDCTLHCRKCGEELVEDVNWSKSSCKYRDYICKNCHCSDAKETQEGYRRKHSDPNKVWPSEYMKTCSRCKKELNAEKHFYYHFYRFDGYKAECRGCSKIEKQTPRAKYSTLKSGAKRRKIEWGLNFEDASGLLLQDCHYCGKPSVEEVKIHGLDRVDNDRGYHIDNVVTCCEQCNTSKSTQTYEDFIKQAHNIAQRHPLENILQA